MSNLEGCSEGVGWVVKIRCTTNSEGVTFCATRVEVIQAIRIAWEQFSYFVDYITVQTKLINKYEYKLVFFAVLLYMKQLITFIFQEKVAMLLLIITPLSLIHI